MSQLSNYEKYFRVLTVAMYHKEMYPALIGCTQ